MIRFWNQNSLEMIGINWDMLRMKSVKIMGEPAVNALETGADAGFTVFQKIKTGGIMGIWEFIKEKFGDLKDVCASGADGD